jgi:hypothetical protein
MSSKLSTLPSVERSTNGEFWVVNATIGPFRTHAATWRWVDRHTDLGCAGTDQHNRIRIAFSKCSAQSNSRA